MHLNYYFLSQIATELQEKLQGAWLLECFTQNKDEVVFGFGKAGEDFYVKCQLGPSFQGLSFVNSFNRAKSNSVDLFSKAKGWQVVDVSVTAHDRSFRISLVIIVGMGISYGRARADCPEIAPTNCKLPTNRANNYFCSRMRVR